MSPPVVVAIQDMSRAELLAEAERQRSAGDELHAAELEFHAAHFLGRPLPSPQEWRAVGKRALAAGEPTAVALVALHRGTR